MSERFAAALLDMGVQAGERVILYIPNTVQWVVAWLGVQRAGAVCLPITPIYTPHDLRYIANDSGAETIVCADTNFGYVTRVLPETGLKRVIVARMADLLPWWKRYFGHLFDVVPRGNIAFGKNVFSFEGLLSGGGRLRGLPEITRGGEDVAEILYTGGTTKFPKGVPLSHSLFLVSMDEQIRVCEPLFPVEENVIMANAPLFHILGQTCSLSILLVAAPSGQPVSSDPPLTPLSTSGPGP
jgi:long-chain acyl-CoA synthetase